METKQNIAHYLGKDTNKYFKIPAYQRGYKWGELKTDSSCDASVLVTDILKAMNSGKSEYFIQGVTVYEQSSDIILIDGQQRTTTLFLLLALVMSSTEVEEHLFFKKDFKLKYEIRESTREYIENFCLGIRNEPNSQDQFFINQAAQKMSKEIPEDIQEREKLKNYILEKVKLFYVQIPEKNAARIFSMLNGSKAFMTTDELVKSAFLSEASKAENHTLRTNNLQDTLNNLKSQIGEEWQTTALRSRFARQWDKWMYWWNREEVKAFFYCSNNPMGRLLEYYYNYPNGEKGIKQYSNNPEDVAIIFKQFQNDFIQNKQLAVDNFESLRKLQKKFEDLYNNATTYNYLGLALVVTDTKDYLKVIHYFISNFKDKSRLKKYTLLRIVEVSHNDIVEHNTEAIYENYKATIDKIQLADVYNDGKAKETAFRILFMLNVNANNDRGVKFEFFYKDKKELLSFYSQRSLEHIWPKSKVAYKTESGNLYTIDEKNNETELTNSVNEKLLNHNNFEKGFSEHCIGNLLFLHKNDNSAFNAKLPEDKKLVYFDLSEQIYSRNLLHTMSAFAITSWQKEKAIDNIKELKQTTINKLNEIYSAYDIK